MNDEEHKQARQNTILDILKWAKQCGHYPVVEALESYMKLKGITLSAKDS